MNKLIILLAVITLSCANTKDSSNDISEPKPKPRAEKPIQKDILLGEFQKEELLQAPFSDWFKPRYEKYTPDTDAMKTIAENIGDYEIKLLMGTWCGDSKREVPKLLKLLDKSNYDYSDLEMIAVDYDKKTPSSIEVELDVHHVPTIIFIKNGEEVNRFVEYSQGESIEEDIAKIVGGKKYKNSYAD
ncbi:TlpA family protein disulfide reductase [Christiangramia salexigens]|uniref:Thiol reductase thioredoxin n=1 Tax=Christiangramia salexigens TaxID=1913577 RepID=A0A1L3J514_9FLAO|nr:thioredoxin family protein [Christiangramia salexigens]APG60200.1 thiol reductase thioredoxin [Christiangramia salexigens]